MKTINIIAMVLIIIGVAASAYVISVSASPAQFIKSSNTGYYDGVVFYMTGSDGVYTDEVPVMARYYTHVVVKGKIESPGGEICYVVPVGGSSIMLIDRYADKRMMMRTWEEIDRERLRSIVMVVRGMGE